MHTHYLRVFLPKEKQKYWFTDIKEALASTKIKTDTLESLIEKLNHAAHVIPPARYFLNWLRHLMKRVKVWGKQRLQLWNCQYLKLWIKLIQRVTTKGVPINNIVFFKPSVALWSDLCEYGIGGYINNGLS